MNTFNNYQISTQLDQVKQVNKKMMNLEYRCNEAHKQQLINPNYNYFQPKLINKYFSIMLCYILKLFRAI